MNDIYCEIKIKYTYGETYSHVLNTTNKKDVHQTIRIENI